MRGQRLIAARRCGGACTRGGLALLQHWSLLSRVPFSARVSCWASNIGLGRSSWTWRRWRLPKLRWWRIVRNRLPKHRWCEGVWWRWCRMPWRWWSKGVWWRCCRRSRWWGCKGVWWRWGMPVVSHCGAPSVE
ncbi:hypothetical protein V6Z11_D12G060100 [Gossypium hirsutum]